MQGPTPGCELSLTELRDFQYQRMQHGFDAIDVGWKHIAARLFCGGTVNCSLMRNVMFRQYRERIVLAYYLLVQSVVVDMDSSQVE
ncbi:hypothetical protein HDU99_007994 [Rhizoclosmatium hyalinum]|nr:hypothetical protein HDU99_007994 [Rhizoclosmatium hyalinum]